MAHFFWRSVYIV